MIAAPARLETRNGHRWWLCPNCGLRLGEVVGVRVVVVVGDRRLSMPLRCGPEQSCPRCGATSVLAAEDRPAHGAQFPNP